jgi:hypothetical protein
MFLDLLASVMEAVTAQGTKVAPWVQLTDTLRHASGVHLVLYVQLVYVCLLREPVSIDPATFRPMAEALMEVISYEDAELTSWILLSLGRLCKLQRKHEGKDQEMDKLWSRLASLVGDRLLG